MCHYVTRQLRLLWGGADRRAMRSADRTIIRNAGLTYFKQTVLNSDRQALITEAERHNHDENKKATVATKICLSMLNTSWSNEAVSNHTEGELFQPKPIKDGVLNSFFILKYFLMFAKICKVTVNKPFVGQILSKL